MVPTPIQTKTPISSADELRLLRRRSFRRVLVADAKLPEATLDLLWRDPDELVRRGVMLKDGDRCTVVRLEHESLAMPLVLKRYNKKGALHTLVHLFMRSRAAWTWRNGWRLQQLGLPSPVPRAVVEERFGPLRLRSFGLTDHVVGEPLRDVVARNALSRDELEAVAVQFADIWKALGHARLEHGDMKATNLLLTRKNNLFHINVIDLDGMRRFPPGPWWRNRRRSDYDRFMRNWSAHPEAAAIFRARIDRA